jgi:tRNA1(Val) A37 N6-methylase TrmN6
VYAHACGLASNVFYEYYKASTSGGDTSFLNAWSHATHQYYTAQCSSGNGLISCAISGTTDPNAQVEFTQDAVNAYTPQQANSYAAQADLGPNG